MTTIYKLEIRFYNVSKKSDDVIYPTIVSKNDENILIDTGYPNMLKDFEDQLKSSNLSFFDIDKVIITHHDHDHMGALSEMLDKYPHLKTFSSKNEKEYIEGKKEAFRLTQANILQKNMITEREKVEGLKFIESLKIVKPVKIDYVIKENDTFLESDLIVINTPGHTIDHISLYIKSLKVLISGDALAIRKEGIPIISNPDFAYNLEDAKASVLKLMDYDIEEVICYHGGSYKDSSINIKNILFNATKI